MTSAPPTPAPSPAADAPPLPPVRRLFDPRTVYAEPAALVSDVGQGVLQRFPGVEVVEVASWQDLPHFADEAAAERWVRVKTEVLVLGEKRSLSARPNDRSSDWIAPSTANGCAMACAYCYVPRRKGFANPVTVFTNIDKIEGYLRRHVARQGVKPVTDPPSQTDPTAWVYDIGENSDVSADALLSDNPRRLVELFRGLPTAKASFATKHVNRELLQWDPQGRARVRFSLMPHARARLLDVRTSPVAERIAAVDDFVEAGYEVHLNLSPVVVHEGWLPEWCELLDELDDVLSPRAKEQAAAEVVFLTHNERLHETNLRWHPRAEDLLWRPDVQQPKRSQTGGWNVRYRTGWKGRWVGQLLEEVERRTPWLRVRYAF